MGNPDRRALDDLARDLPTGVSMSSWPSGGACCVISLLRLYLDANEERFRGRALKEAMHELGHTFGLGHCADPSCVNLEETDRERAAYTDPRCEEMRLARRPP